MTRPFYSIGVCIIAGLLTCGLLASGCAEESPGAGSSDSNPVGDGNDGAVNSPNDATLSDAGSSADVSIPETSKLDGGTSDGFLESDAEADGIESADIQPNDTTDVEQLSDTVQESNPDPFTAGGLIASYFTPTLTEEGTRDQENPWTRLFMRLDSVIDFPGIDASFGDYSVDAPLRVEWEGAFKAEKTGTYTLQVTGANSFRLSLHGEVIAEAWDTGTYSTQQHTVELQSGWHPILLEYEGTDDSSLVVLSAKRPGGFMEVISTEHLGVPAIPDNQEPALTLMDVQVEEIWAYGANISMRGSTAIKAEAQWTSLDGIKGTVPSSLDQFHSSQSISLVLTPGVSYSVVVKITDIWGREYQTVPLPVQTPDPGEFVIGGLYGSYYDGSEFNSLLMHRIDPQVRLPEDTDGNPNGSFATPMGGNTFSIRWSGAIWVAETGTYTLYVGGNDGYRFLLDGELVFDSWVVQDANFSQITQELSQGWHPIQLEYFEATGAASITLEWESMELGIERAPIPPENLGNSYIFENNEADPSILSFSGQAAGATSATFEWTTSELCTSILFYRIVDGFTQEIIVPETSLSFDVPASGWKWTFQEIEDGGELVGRVVVKDLLQNSDASEEVKFEIEGEMDD